MYSISLKTHSTKDIMIYDVLKKCNINLWCIHKLNKQLNYKISNNLEFVMDNKKESEFKLINNESYYKIKNMKKKLINYGK